MNFYQNFVRLCSENGIKPTAAALNMGLQRSSVTRWKNGGSPTDASLLRICDYFHVDPSYFDEKNPTNDVHNPEKIDLTIPESTLLELFRSMNDEGQSKLLEYAEFVAARNPSRSSSSLPA